MRDPIIYVDVDDTLVRTDGSKRIPVPAVIDHVRKLADKDDELYLWSEVALRTPVLRRTNSEAQVASERSFRSQMSSKVLNEWRRLLGMHPSNCQRTTLTEYKTRLSGA